MGCRERNWIGYGYMLAIWAGIVRQIEPLARRGKAVARVCETRWLTSTPDMLRERKRVESSRLMIEGIPMGQSCCDEVTVDIDTSPISSTNSYA
jgi:hypothetical protein